MPNATIHTHCQVTQCQVACQNLPKSMSANRTVVNRDSLPLMGKDGIQQGLRKHRGSVAFEAIELLDRSPIQNFDNEKSN